MIILRNSPTKKMLYLHQKSGQVNFDEFLNLELAGESDSKFYKKNLIFWLHTNTYGWAKKKKERTRGSSKDINNALKQTRLNFRVLLFKNICMHCKS